jgi:Na+-transporting methylmalonyl-CoA/oxaloacetate decarboxylase gamma subunit
MDKWSFGLTLLVVGVGGTFLTLWVLGLATELLKKFFPLSAEEEKK